jgi:hypothetical protein
VQIVKKHWRRFLPGQSQLDHDQKREFAFGWLSWLGVEIVAVAAALLNLIWLPFVVFQVVAIPDPLLLLPSVAVLLVSLLHLFPSYPQGRHRPRALYDEARSRAWFAAGRGVGSRCLRPIFTGSSKSICSPRS